MAPSRLDNLYRRMLITRFFERGWGKPENLQRLVEFRKIISQRSTCYPLVPKDYPVQITKAQRYPECLILEGSFLTPLELHLPGIVPKAAQSVHFQAILPNFWPDRHKPMCIHLAGTGDHFFWRRRNLIAKPLLKEGNIGAIILENPFYGTRKPDSQVRSNLHNVSDIFVMGGCLILECLVLLHWCERNGFGPLGITGLSMGGHMASLAATNWPKPLVLVPCLSWSTAATVFTTFKEKIQSWGAKPHKNIDIDILTAGISIHPIIFKFMYIAYKGVMSQSINWDMLETQYYSDGKYSERLSKMVTVIDDAFKAGQKFIRNFNESLIELEKDIKNTKFLKSPTANISEEDNNNRSLTRLMKFILPNSSSDQKIDVTKINWWEREALQFMRGMMDECTHLKNFSVPKDTSLIIAVCAKDDAYVPREGCSGLEEIWPGVEVRYLDAGHVSAYVLHQKLFRSCIIEAFDRAKKLNKETFDKEISADNFTYHLLLEKYMNAI